MKNASLISAPKQILASLIIAILIISSIGVAFISPAFAAVNATIEASSSKAPWAEGAIGDAFLVQISIVEPDLAGDATQNDDVTITIKQKNKAGGTVDTDTVQAEEVSDSGLFIIGLNSDGAATFGNEPTGWTPTYFEVGASVAEQADGEIEVSYLDASGPSTIKVIVQLDTVDPSVTSDRDETPDDGLLRIEINDNDRNFDPTSLDTFTEGIALEISYEDGTSEDSAQGEGATYTFTETDVNSGEFETDPIQVDTELIDGEGLSAVGDGDILVIEWEDEIGEDDDDVVVEIVLDEGLVSLPESITYTSELDVTIIDSDQNKDTQSEDETDTAPVTIEVLDDNMLTVLDTETMDVEETDDNTGVFEEDIDVSFDFATREDANGVVEVLPGEKIRVSYNDPSEDEVTSIKITQIASIDPALDASPEAVKYDGSIQLTLDAPNLDDDDGKRGSFTLEEGGNSIIEEGDTFGYTDFVTPSGTLVGELRVRVQTDGSGPFEEAIIDEDFSLVFRETDEDSGVFELTSKLKVERLLNEDGDILEDGDIIEIRWRDKLDEDEPTTTVKVTVSAFEASISFDRDEYPVGRGEVVVRLTIEDPDANDDDDSIETIVIGDDPEDDEDPRVEDIGGDELFDIPATVLTETEADSGIFEAEIVIDQTDPNTREWINAKLIIEYFDISIDDTVDAFVKFRIHDASVSVNIKDIKYGDEITVTIDDPDRNLDAEEEEEWETIEVDGEEWDLIVLEYTDLDSGNEVEDIFEMEETGPNTGVFEVDIEVGEDFKPDLTEDITLTYVDITPITAAPTADPLDWPDEKDFEIEFGTSTSTGVLSISPSGEFGPGTELTITLKDFDLNQDIGDEDETEEVGEDLVRVKSSTCKGGVTINLEETDVSTGIFDEEIQLIVPEDVDDIPQDCGAYGDVDVDPDVWDYVQQFVDDDEYWILAIVGDNVQVVYLDEDDAEGKSKSSVVTGMVKSWDPVISFDGEFFNPGEVVTVSIDDFDANIDPDTIDTFDITIESTSDPIGLPSTAVETDENTGIFEVSFTIDDEVEKDVLFVNIGDEIIVTYTDEYPADYAEEEEDKDFIGIAKVGVIPEFSVPASKPTFTDLQGQLKTQVTRGSTVLINVQLENIAAASQDYTAIIQVKNSKGVVTQISFVIGNVDEGKKVTIGASWTPTVSDTYTIEAFVWSDLQASAILSSPSMITTNVV
jgi:hypothetical protein